MVRLGGIACTVQGQPPCTECQHALRHVSNLKGGYRKQGLCLRSEPCKLAGSCF